VPRRSSFRTVALLMVLPVAGLLLFVGYRFIRDRLPQLARTQPSAVPSVHDEAGALPVVKRKAKPPVAPENDGKHRGDIVLILDDVGFDRQPLESAMGIDPNLNFSILPNARQASAFAHRLHGRGFEVLCHLPMEPIGYPRQSPGANAVMTSMSDAEIARTTRQNVGAVPFAVGMNNHMGSRATTDARVMTEVLSALPKGMFYIDSRTTSGSVGERVARQMKIPTASRNVFLDDVQEETAIRKQLAELASTAESRGLAVGIGHIYPVTVRVLVAEVPQLRDRGFRLVRASDAVH
jgi:polysaccharide deacetylase 2 family uncharacterized protein YibQ